MGCLFTRVQTQLEIFKHRAKPGAIYLLTLHSDLDAVFTGGTEGHARQLRTLLLSEKNAVLTLTPRHQKQEFVLRGMWGREVFLEEFFQPESLSNVIFLLEHFVDHLHVHHVWKWPREAVERLTKSAFKTKVISLHDFWFLCPSIKLMTEKHPERFCEVETDLGKCNACLVSKWRHTQENIQAFRRITYTWLERFGTILFPSFSMVAYFQKAYGEAWNTLASKIKILPHDLRYLLKLGTPARDVHFPKRICFIGALNESKGSRIILDAIPLLQEKGFTVEIFGSISPAPEFSLQNVKIKSFSSPEQLAQLFGENGEPGYIAIVSIWAETFSYTFYEGLFLTTKSIPIVGPFGNPAQVCRETEMGVVMQECSAQALVDAVCEAEASEDSYRQKRSHVINEMKSTLQESDYLTEYVTLTKESELLPKSFVKPPALLTKAFLIQASAQEAHALKASRGWRKSKRKLIQRLKRIKESVMREGFVTSLRRVIRKWLSF